MGSIDTALFVADPSYEHDAVMIVDDVVVSLGGKGLIAAVAMLHEGADVAPLALIGRDSAVAELIPGDLKDTWLHRGQIEDSRIWLTISGTDHVTAWVSIGRRSVSDAELRELATAYTQSVDALYLSFETLPLLRFAFQAAEHRDMEIAVNLSRPLIDTLLRDEPTLLPNLVSRAHFILCNADESARVLRALAAPDWGALVGRQTSVVVTEGASGGIFAPAPLRDWRRYPAVAPTVVRSVVGAGDTFNGALLAAVWTHGLALPQACERAAALASVCTSLTSSSIAGHRSVSA
jgi:sugar/nucleoside kinase (ribokinase family)